MVETSVYKWTFWRIWGAQEMAIAKHALFHSNTQQALFADKIGVDRRARAANLSPMCRFIAMHYAARKEQKCAP